MQAVATVEELRQCINHARQAGRKIGCVPTMGALHAGHMSLVEYAKRETDFVVVTIFVNPTQFGPNEDFTKYPRPLERDLQMCRESGVDLVFHPEVSAVYPTGATTFVEVGGLSTILEGAFRPGHFRGVATVVLKLFNMVQPDVAFFGQKDYQQQLLIKHMARDLDVPVRIQTCPTMREPDGLAMSSRNVYLNADERQTAVLLSQSLKIAEQLCQQPGTKPADVNAAMHRHLSSDPRVRIDYATLVDAHSLNELTELKSEMVAVIAARVGTTRLIDNQLISMLMLLIAALSSFVMLSTAAATAADPTKQRLPATKIQSELAVNSVARSSATEIRFGRDIVPALTKAGCSTGACHGSFQGRGGLQLSLLGFDADFDHEVLTKGSLGRRVSVAAPETSLLLLKPLGSVPHGGGRRITADSEVAYLLRQWLSAGMPGPRADDLIGLKLSVEPAAVVVPLSQPNVERSTSLRVQASFAAGTSRDITAWALFDVRDKTIAEVSREGIITAQRAGKTAVSVRYLGQVASVEVSVPFGTTSEFEFPPQNFIDELAAAEWKRLGIKPAELADDATFLRRVYLDVIGTLPSVREARDFLTDLHPDKRQRVIDELLKRGEYVDYWSLKWGDLLRAHRRFLGDKGLASFNGWIRQSVRDNKPIDVLSRELLTAQGNLFTNGPVAYYFIDEKVEDLAETTAQVFLGVRLQCTKCHHHPNEVWSQEDYYGLAAFFTKLETKDSGAQGAKFGGPKSLRVAVNDNPNRKPQRPAVPRLFSSSMTSASTTSVTPVTQTLNESMDPRVKLAEWVTHADNPYFARNVVNRTWAALFGIGLVEPVDDLRGSNPASIPTVLDALAADFVKHRFDRQHLIRTICNSRVYQLAAELKPERDADGTLFTHRTPRRHSAEVFLDAINQVTGTVESFPGQPPGTRAISLPDPTINSYFLTTFGKPPRASACDCARGAVVDLSQALHLVNSPLLHDKIASSTGRLSQHLAAKRTDSEILEDVCLAAYGRFPNDDERRALQDVLPMPQHVEGWQDFYWAVLNSAEFTFNH